MAVCRFVSPDLVTSLAGIAAKPTFAFDASNTNYFGLAGSFTSADNTNIYSFSTRTVNLGRTSTYPAITPIITTAGRAITCSALKPASIVSASAGLTTYSGIECPTATGKQLAPGTYTLRFAGNGIPSIASQTFIVASPTFMTDLVTATIVQTATASPFPASTTTVTDYTSTVTVPEVSGIDETITTTLTAPPVTIINVCSTIVPTSTDVSDSSTSSTEVPESSTTSTDTSVSSSSSTPVPDIPTSSTDLPGSSTTSSASTPIATKTISSDGRCGSFNGQTCIGFAAGNCCSSYGFCGNTNAHCLTSEGCNPQFGSCITPSVVSSSAAPSPTSTVPVSPDGSCGNNNNGPGYVCTGSGYGDCCSSYGWCGESSAHCDAGCQNPFGICSTPSETQTGTAPLPTSTLKVSPDGSCGGENGYVCTGTSFGQCCSPYGYCGESSAHCGAGCQNPFGVCPGASGTQTGTAPLPTSTLKVSLNGECGTKNGQTCEGSDYGTCCSEYGYCGSSAVYCSAGCQSGFGSCSAPVKRFAVGFGDAVKKAGKAIQKRVIGGAGPDYTYPPTPRVTSTVGTTQIVTVTPTGGVSTTTVFDITTTTVGTGSGAMVTETATVTPTSSVCA